jgi:hypothetical protein
VSAKRRRFKEPEVPAGSPFAPPIAAALVQMRALTHTLPADEEAKALVLERVAGMETVILLCRRAAAGEKLDAPHLVKVERAPAAEGGLAERVRELEARVAALEGRPSASGRPMPEILRAPKKATLKEALKEARSGGLGRCERALLAVLAQREGEATSAAQLAVLSGYSFKSSGFQNALSRLRSLGFAEGGADNVRVTADGGRESEDLGLAVAPMPTGRDLVDYWVRSLPKAEGTILRALCIAHPDPLDQDQLSAATNYSRTSSGFQNAVSKLRSLKLATKGWPVQASPIFFEGGQS